jgi:hypothetical protein
VIEHDVPNRRSHPGLSDAKAVRQLSMSSALPSRLSESVIVTGPARCGLIRTPNSVTNPPGEMM